MNNRPSNPIHISSLYRFILIIFFSIFTSHLILALMTSKRVQRQSTVPNWRLEVVELGHIRLESILVYLARVASPHFYKINSDLIASMTSSTDLQATSRVNSPCLKRQTSATLCPATSRADHCCLVTSKYEKTTNRSASSATYIITNYLLLVISSRAHLHTS